MFKTLTSISSTSTRQLTPVIETVPCRCSVRSQVVGSCTPAFDQRLWDGLWRLTGLENGLIVFDATVPFFCSYYLPTHSCKYPIRVVVMIVGHRCLISGTKSPTVVSESMHGESGIPTSLSEGRGIASEVRETFEDVLIKLWVLV